MVSQELAKFVLKTNYQNIPTAALQKAKASLVDSVGTMLAGAKEDAGIIIVRYVEKTGGAPAASLVGHKIKSSVYNAAMANGTMGHVQDYDDMSPTLIGHPSISVLPAVLALGEEQKISGEKMLSAFTIGIEVECKIGRGTIPQHYENGWHPTATIGIFGAAAASAKILGLSEQEIIYALGIAGSESSGLRENFGTMTKPFHAGRAAAKGIMSAMLAKEGFTSTPKIFEGKAGFCKVMAVEYDENKIIDRLGNPFDVEDPGFTIKPYPTCGAAHPAIDAVISLSREHDLKADEIQQIKCGTVPIGRDVLIYPKPATPLEAKFSMEYCLAVALIERKVGFSQFSDEKINAPEIKQLLEKVDMYLDPEMSDLGYRGTFNANIKIVLKDGKEYSKRVDHGRGDPANPLTEEELLEKYSDCAALALDSEKIKRSKEMLSGLEQLSDISLLMDILRS